MSITLGICRVTTARGKTLCENADGFRLTRCIVHRLTTTAVALLIAAGSAWGQLSHKPDAVPRFVDLTLAGVHLGGGGDDIKFDPKSGYYLHTDGEMASGPIDVELFLTPDAKQPGVNDDAPVDAAEDPGLPQVVRTRHLLLQTGRGVRIGDTTTQVRQKLGAAPIRQEYHVKTGARVYQYEAAIPVHWVLSARERRDYYRTGNWYYRGVYVFHRERLWSIRLLAARDPDDPQLW